MKLQKCLNTYESNLHGHVRVPVLTIVDGTVICLPRKRKLCVKDPNYLSDML